MDLSLDEIIIKSKKNNGIPVRNGSARFIGLRKTLNKPGFKPAYPPRIVDARLKIVQKKRQKIHDARDRLAELTRAQGDVRKRLLEKKKTVSLQTKHSAVGNGHAVQPTNYRNGSRVPMSPHKIAARPHATKRMAAPVKLFRQTSHETIKRRVPNTREPPRGYVDYDNMQKMEEEEYAAARGLSRTVKNDINPYDDNYNHTSSLRSEPKPAVPRRLNSWGPSSPEQHYDPFEVYDVPPTHRERRLPSPEILPPPPPKAIMHTTNMRERSPDLYQRRYIPDNTSHLSYEMRTRLERAPDPHASMGIFGNSLKSPISISTSSSSLSLGGQYSPDGYRIVVSNLNHNITNSDIRELFEDIGELYDSRIVRPGVAEVIYKTLGDAEKAVETYHNRQLDNQPMKCLLVNPRSFNKPTAPAYKSSSSASSRLVSNKTPLEIDIDALHKVLFRRH